MYTASLLFTLALVATTFALPIANPDYIATAVVTENDVVVVTVTAGSPAATQNNNEKQEAAVTTPAAAPAAVPVKTSAAPVPTTHWTAPAASSPAAVENPGVFAQVNKASSTASPAVQSPKTTSTPTPTPAPTLLPALVSTILGGGGAQSNGQELTITLINSYGKAISTKHQDNEANVAATGVNGNIVTATTMANGATGVFAVPENWGGNVAIADAEYEITDNGSLLEGSYSVQGSAGLQTDIDVSYVNGFSVPIMCKCTVASTNLFQKVTGISTDLFAAGGCTDKSGTGQCGKCQELDGHGACKNPNRSAGATDRNITTDAFFEPAHNHAYTFPFDGDGGNNGNSKCAGAITCCVGTSCA